MSPYPHSPVPMEISVEGCRPSTSSTDGEGFAYDVFLSFRGEDTRKRFTGHLHQALKQRGLRVFIDSEDLEKGKRIGELFKAIEASKVFIPIFSKRYAESKWCLREISHMMRCERLTLPIFFDVKPSDVRNQDGPYRKAFLEHQNGEEFDEETVKEWRSSLKKAGETSGYDLQYEMDGDEATLVQKVVSRALRELSKTLLDVAAHPIGIDSRVLDVMNLLKIEDSDVYIVGMQGMGGIGKTTIAKAIYNNLYVDFQGSSFISDVSGVSKQPRGLVSLQKQLIEDILSDQVSSITSVSQGIRIIKQRIRSTRVLIVLDDVDHKAQLNALAGAKDWFGLGSRIIITTRDEQVLLLHHVEPHQIYKPTVLNESQSTQLFLNHAFGNHQPNEEYLELSKRVVAASGGLPLALEVFGSHLCGKRNAQDWEDMIENLKHIQPDDVHRRLKISYDGLSKEEQLIFLDISCFFIGRDRERATHMWMDLGFSPNMAIQVLVQKALVKINSVNQKFEMHDQIRDLAREIVRQESPFAAELRSRLWTSRQIMDVWQTPKGARMVQSMTLNSKQLRYFSAEAFEAMPNLRLLHVSGINFQGKFRYFPSKLKWLELESCNFDYLPSQYQLEKIVVLDLCQSNMAQAFTKLCSLEEEVFDTMKFLRICSEDLTSTPNFSATPCLVNLVFNECRRLSGVHKSIGNLKNLTCLDMRTCWMLEKLPDTICKLSSLKILNLSDCRKLSSLPELGDLESLRELTLDCTSIGIIPHSIGRLENLYFLSVEGCSRLKELPQSIRSLKSLEELRVKGTSLEGMPPNIDDLMNIGTVSAPCSNWLSILPSSSYRTVRCLRFFDPKYPTIEELPDSIGQLQNLERLSLDCRNLRSFPASFGLLERLSSFSLCGSQWIKELPNSMENLKNLVQLEISRTSMFVMPHCIGRLTNLRSLNLSHNPKLLISLSGLTALSSLEVLIAHNSSWAEDDDAYHGDFGNLSSLKIIDLRGSHFRALPSCINRIPVLQELNLESCLELQSLPGLPASLVSLDAFKCASIKMISDVSNLESMKELHLDGCSLLVDVCGLESLTSLEILTLRNCHSLGDAFKNRAFKEATFPQLRKFEISGTMIPHSPDSPQLSFMFPRAPTGDQLIIEFLFLQGVSKPVQPFRKPIGIKHVQIAVITDGSVVFQTRREMECSFVLFKQEDEIFRHLREGHHVIQVSAEGEGLTVGDIWVRYEKGGD